MKRDAAIGAIPANKRPDARAFPPTCEGLQEGPSGAVRSNSRSRRKRTRIHRLILAASLETFLRKNVLSAVRAKVGHSVHADFARHRCRHGKWRRDWGRLVVHGHPMSDYRELAKVPVPPCDFMGKTLRAVDRGAKDLS